jgi:arsenite methyltransferase
MGQFDDPRLPPRDAARDDWDPSNAHNGYTGRMRALRDIAAPPDPSLGQLTPGQPALAPQSPGGLTSSAKAVLARAATPDYLTVTYDLAEPGFAEAYDSVIVPQWSAHFGRLLISLFLTLPRTSGWQVLDVGCGTGYPTLELARFLGKDCDLAGLDIWPEAIAIAKRKASDEWLRNVTFLVGDIANSGLPEQAFDLVTCNLALASFADLGGSLGAIWRHLRPGGQLLLTTPLQAAMREFLDIYYLTLRDLKLDDALRRLVAMIGARPTTEMLRGWVERSGFHVQRVLDGNFSLNFQPAKAIFSSFLVQTLYLESWRGLLPDDSVRRIVFNEVERRLDARAQVIGGHLTMTIPMAAVHATRIS